MDVKYLKQVALGFLSVVLVLSILCYVVYHMTNGFSAEIKTTPALMGQYYESEEAEGYIFRQENVLSSKYSGTVNYNVNNGERVSVGTRVAQVYERTGDESLTSGMVAIDKKIEMLRASNISDNVSVSDTKACDDDISRYLEGMRQSKRNGNFAAAGSSATELLVLLNRREIIVSSRTSYNDIIESLEAERAVLAAKLSGTNEPVIVEESGYFYYDCDGYESVFLPELLDGMTPGELGELVSRTPDGTEYVGKNVTSQKWYMALTLDRAEISRFETGDSYKIAFNDYSGLFVDMTLEQMNAEADSALLVFSSNDMPAGFGYERSQSVSIITAEHEGLRFPMSAIRINDGVEGVFVLYGNTVFFRVAEVIGVENGYAVVKADTDTYIKADGTGDGSDAVWSAVALYDEVIVSGTGLYHTMIVN